MFHTESQYRILKRWQLKLAGLLNQQVRDAAELLPRYEVDNISVSDKFKKRFPEFRVTTFREGLTAVAEEPMALAVDLSDDLLSAVLLVPLEEGFPVLGGRTLRVNAGVELSFANDRPLVKLRGVSLMGVPIPNAWLGNLKNVDLVNEFGASPGFWQSFAAGVDYIQVEEGRLLVRLKE